MNASTMASEQFVSGTSAAKAEVICSVNCKPEGLLHPLQATSNLGVALVCPLPALSSQSDLQAGSEREREGGNAKSVVIVIAGQVLNTRIEAQMRVQPVAPAEINFLVRLGQILVGQEHGVAEEAVCGESAVIAPAHKISAQAQRVARLGIQEKEAAGMRRAAKGAVAHQRAKNSDRNIGKCRARAWRPHRPHAQSIAGKCPPHHSIQVGIGGASAEAVSQIQLQFGFRTKGARVCRIY